MNSVQFGLKNVRYNVIFMANDDIDLPTSLIGKKVTLNHHACAHML